MSEDRPLPPGPVPQRTHGLRDLGAGGGGEGGPPGLDRRWGRLRRLLVSLVPVVVLALALGLVHLPYWVISPGPTESVQPLIKVSGHGTYPSRGQYRLVTVDLQPANAYQALGAWLSASDALVPQSEILAPGQTQSQYIQQGYSEMDQSKIDAAAVALGAVSDYPKNHGRGALVESTAPGTPAAGRLFPGDVVTAVDGRPVATVKAVERDLRAGAGHPLRLTVRSEEGGHVHRVSVTPAVGAIVEQTFPGTPASRMLRAGDVITAVNGKAVTGVEQIAREIRAAGVGHALKFTVRRGGATMTVSIAPVRVPHVSYPIIGVSLAGDFGATLIPDFPFPIAISSGNIGGPSAGLMWTLGLIDLLSPGDLTHGRVIAGTGQIDLSGNVLPIGGIQQKVVAAERAHAAVFFAPASEAASARAVATDVPVVGVRTYRDALAWLRAHP